MTALWIQDLFAKSIAWLARKSWRGCVHGKDVVLCIEGPYPMCPLCIEIALRGEADRQLAAHRGKEE